MRTFLALTWYIAFAWTLLVHGHTIHPPYFVAPLVPSPPPLQVPVVPDRAMVLRLALPALDDAGRRFLYPTPGDCTMVSSDAILDEPTREALADCRRQGAVHDRWSEDEARAIGYEIAPPDIATGMSLIVRVTSLSRVGMSRDGRTAVVAVAIGCGPLCGSAVVERYRRSQETWQHDSMLEGLAF